MRYEDKIGYQFMSDQSFSASRDRGVAWTHLSKNIRAAAMRHPFEQRNKWNNWNNI